MAYCDCDSQNIQISEYITGIISEEDTCTLVIVITKILGFYWDTSIPGLVLKRIPVQC